MLIIIFALTTPYPGSCHVRLIASTLLGASSEHRPAWRCRTQGRGHGGSNPTPVKFVSKYSYMIMESFGQQYVVVPISLLAMCFTSRKIRNTYQDTSLMKFSLSAIPALASKMEEASWPLRSEETISSSV